MSVNAIAALMISIIGMVLLLGYLGTTAGAEWTTIMNNVAPFAVIIAIAILCIALALRRA